MQTCCTIVCNKAIDVEKERKGMPCLSYSGFSDGGTVLRLSVRAYMCVIDFRLKQGESDKLAAEETARKLGQIILEKDSKRYCVLISV